MVFAGILGLIAWRHRRVALAGISLLGVVGLVTAIYRGSMVDGVPSVAAGLVGVGALGLLSTLRGERAVAQNPNGPRRTFLLGLGIVGALAALGGGGGLITARVRDGATVARRAMGLPAAASRAEPIPDGAQIAGMTPFRTPIEDFYRVDISLITPQITTEGWTLTIDGCATDL